MTKQSVRSCPLLTRLRTKKAGEAAREFMGTKHWWKNTGTQAVDLTISDIVNDKKPATMERVM